MLTGLNHLTLAVSDLTVSFSFYRDVLSFTPRARWDRGAYLSLGDLWLCLSLDKASPAQDYTHFAFTLAEADRVSFRNRLQCAGVIEWKENRSEGESIYFLDPDGHQLEAHCGDLASRLRACREKPYRGMEFF
ncbi:fosfomycin resistance glutathione transferase [Pantoea sp. At-9b]|uniref:fosfomycin resistance glutathione transferase n=1 Tax=Pantoea sp. (strain At-9b) TaxID=592316 RepID=UPI0001B3DF87|nr:fosfomycin resistance glutathione transferase [Pantoea sp. At-9b]ADU71462.1 Glutathione transferase [Pantoea sp. At-9b]